MQPVVAGKVSAVPGTVHPKARAEYDQGPVAGSMALHGMSIDFQRTAAQQASLAALLKAQQDPSSAQYRQWLTPEQFGEQFGMSQQDIAKVTTWLQSQGFTIDKVADSRNSIRFSGTAAVAEAAFHTQIHKYLVSGENHFANASAVALPSVFAGAVLRVGGLNDFKPKARLVHPASLRNGGAGKPKFTSGISGDHFLAPGDFAVIYDLKPLYSAGYTGKGQTIGIAGQTDIVQADITDFRSAAGLSVNNPTVYLIPGSGDPGISYDDLTEADLDLEWSGGVAYDASIVFLNSTNALDSLQYAIENKINGVQIPILSSSYGDCEPNYTSADIASLEASFQEANAQGQTVLSASGDSGAADCDYSTSTTTVTAASGGLQVDYPASSAYVTGMGGGEFMGDGTASDPDVGTDQYWSSNGSNDVLTSALSYIPEMAWNDSDYEIANGGGIAAGGGGVSSLFTKPSWQTGVPGIPSDGHRDVPDLVLNASPDHDPYLICTQVVLDSSSGGYSSSCTNGFRISDPGFDDDTSLSAVGGTSAAAPSFAGILAVIEQKLGAPGLGNLNPSLYTLASNASTYASAFHDITTGNNIVPCAAGSTDCGSSGDLGYSAATGYDEATGLGSVDANNLATALSSVATQAGSTTTVSLSPTTPVVGAAVTLTATVTANSGTTVPTGSVTFTVDGVALSTVPLTAGVATATTTFSTGGTHTVIAAYSGDTNFYASNTTSTFTVSAAPTAAPTKTTLSASPTSVALGGSITLTASVQSSTTGTIAGTVTFTIGGTTVGTATVAAGASGTGTATLTVNATAALGFTAGTDTIVASYGGDSDYAASNGSATITVTNPQIAMTIPNMTISSSSPGNSGTSTITLTSTGGYSGTVDLTATASSLNANYSIDPTTVVLTSGGTGTATISIETIASSLRSGAKGNLRKTTTSKNRIVAGAAAAFGCIFLLGIPGFRKRRWPARTAVLLLAGLGAGIGCGGGSSGASGAGNYTVTVTATDSANSAITTSTNFTVTIQ